MSAGSTYSSFTARNALPLSAPSFGSACPRPAACRRSSSMPTRDGRKDNTHCVRGTRRAGARKTASGAGHELAPPGRAPGRPAGGEDAARG